MQGCPTGGKILSESKFELNPNGSSCADVKARNSGGTSEVVVEVAMTGAVVVAAAVVVTAMAEGGGLREQEE